MTPETKKQISNLKLDPNKPIVIFDADEVLVHFAKPFSNFLEKHKRRLKLTGYVDSINLHIMNDGSGTWIGCMCR